MQPSFILSSARSGSTLTRFLLDTHPDIYAPGELRMGELARVLYWYGASLEGRLGLRHDENAQVLTWVREVLTSRLEAKAREQCKRMWCEKTPNNLVTLRFLTAIFPEARFICLYRHALDVAHSFLERSRFGFLSVLERYVHRSPANTVQAAVQYWVDCTSALLDLEREKPEQTFRLRYEDIVLGPDAALPPVFGFLGVDWNPTILQAAFTTPHELGEGDRYVRYSGRIHTDSLGAGRNLPVDSLPQDLRQRMTSLLAELGYEATPVPAKPAAPDDSRQVEPVADPQETPAWVFETLVAERLGAIGRSLPPLSCTVDVLGRRGGVWSIEIGDSVSRVIPGGETPSRIEIQAADLLDIVHGRANARKLAEKGKILIRGELNQESLRNFLLLIRTDLEGIPGGAARPT